MESNIYGENAKTASSTAGKPGALDTLSDSTSAIRQTSTVSSDSDDAGGSTAKSGRRRLFGFGKRKEENKTQERRPVESQPSMDSATSLPRSVPTGASTSPVRSSNTTPNHPYQHTPTSPTRNLYSSSPRIASPAGSQIFERDVQETTLPVPNSPAIPSHIIAENYIPPVLNASSEAITDDQLDPDSVEIVMHSAHHPASLAVAGLASNDLTSSWPEELVSPPSGASPALEREDSASNYGNLDAPDVRRLSFISFADVVQSEHAEQSTKDSIRESVHLAGLRPLSPTNRSPSPVRSPGSSQGLDASPPRSKSASMKGIELSPGRVGRPLGSPTAGGFMSASGELQIETMSQALRKTRSGDLAGVKSQPMSPVSLEATSEAGFK